MADQILNLSTTEFDRPTVLIDETAYEMRSPDELSVELQNKLQNIEDELKDRDDAELDEHDENLGRRVMELMVGLPADVVAKLTPTQKMRIIGAFFGLWRRSIRDVVGDSKPSPTPSASTGAN